MAYCWKRLVRWKKSSLGWPSGEAPSHLFAGQAGATIALSSSHAFCSPVGRIHYRKRSSSNARTRHSEPRAPVARRVSSQHLSVFRQSSPSGPRSALLSRANHVHATRLLSPPPRCALHLTDVFFPSHLLPNATMVSRRALPERKNPLLEPIETTASKCRCASQIAFCKADRIAQRTSSSTAVAWARPTLP
jgi:hypothetical protein